MYLSKAKSCILTVILSMPQLRLSVTERCCGHLICTRWHVVYHIVQCCTSHFLVSDFVDTLLYLLEHSVVTRLQIPTTLDVGAPAELVTALDIDTLGYFISQ